MARAWMAGATRSFAAYVRERRRGLHASCRQPGAVESGTRPATNCCCCCCCCHPVLDTGVISRAAGSAYMELGDTKVMAAV
jgi:hypothetical protein